LQDSRISATRRVISVADKTDVSHQHASPSWSRLSLAVTPQTFSQYSSHSLSLVSDVCSSTSVHHSYNGCLPAAISILLLLTTFTWGVMVMMNFDRGLKVQRAFAQLAFCAIRRTEYSSSSSGQEQTEQGPESSEYTTTRPRGQRGLLVKLTSKPDEHRVMLACSYSVSCSFCFGLRICLFLPHASPCTVPSTIADLHSPVVLYPV